MIHYKILIRKRWYSFLQEILLMNSQVTFQLKYLKPQILAK